MPHLLQNLLIILLSGYMLYDHGTGVQLIGRWPVTIGLIMGLIMGDTYKGLVIGGTLQLMSLGVAGLGGASVPEYGVSTIVGVFLAVRSGSGTGTAIAVGLPVGMLSMQLDVVFKMINNFFAHLEERYLHQKKFKKMQIVFIISIFSFALKYMIPVALTVLFGPSLVKLVLNVIPKWFITGLSIAGGMLPVVGIGLLMQYMPTKKYLTFIIIGFVLSAYLELPILGVALLGLGAAYLIYKTNVKRLQTKTMLTNSAVGGDDYDE